MDKTVFSSNQLPPGLTDKERFCVWGDFCRQLAGTFEFASPEPFAAHNASVPTKAAGLARPKAKVAERVG